MSPRKALAWLDFHAGDRYYEVVSRTRSRTIGVSVTRDRRGIIDDAPQRRLGGTDARAVMSGTLLFRVLRFPTKP